ncbi:MAG: M13 family metallopeptidase [Butyrivibrio sp.]|nr:M13 family metallopeptidase [Butyrivibrio sp.]
MKKRFISSIIAASFIMSACAGSTTTESSSVSSSVENTASENSSTNVTSSEETAVADSIQADATTESSEETSEKDISNGYPWINSNLKENVSEDTVTDSKDDFSLYVNKDWILASEIPDGYSSWSHYDERSLDVQNECMELLQDDTIEGHNAELIHCLYNYYLDWDSRNAIGVSPLEDISSQILKLESIDQVTEMLLADETKYEVNNFMSFGVSSGIDDSSVNVMYAGAGSLLLEDSAEYAERTEYGDILYNFWHDIYTYLTGRLGMDEKESEEIFDKAMEFEGLLSESIMTSEEKLSSDYISKVNNPMSFDEACNLVSNYPLKDLLTTFGYVYDGIYIITDMDFMSKIDELYNDSNIEGIKSDMYVRYILSNASVLDKETREYINDANNKYFGTTGSLSEEESAYNIVSTYLPTALQLVYLDKYASEEARQKVSDLCVEVIDTYKEMLNENEWMSDETKKYAIEKLDTMVIHVAYPDNFRDLSDIDISNMTYIEALNEITMNDIEYNRSKLGTKTSDKYWGDDINILECNAYYDPFANTINMVIGMMGEPFYSDNMSIEELYASMAAFWIGHEVSHAFDTNGAQFDAYGNFNNWWTDEDYEEYSKRIEKMDNYLDTIIPFGDYHVNGSSVDTEMLADTSGVQCALKMASKIDDFDYEAFFIKYAQMNASIDLYSLDISMIQQDEHPLNYLRTNVPVQQFDEFFETFGITEGDNMYLAPEDRLLVW